jgi:chromosome segregation ATPase
MTAQETAELFASARQYLAMPSRAHHHPPRIGDALISELLSLCESLQRDPNQWKSLYQEAEKANTELRADLQRHIEIASQAQTELAQVKAELSTASVVIRAAKKELAQARKDAERYRWLIENDIYNMLFSYGGDKEEIDAAIDAAQKEGL